MSFSENMQKGRYAKIIGTGSFLPPNKYTTADMKKYFPQIDLEESKKSIGVETRYFARNFETGEMCMTNSDMTCLAAKRAMEDARVSPEEIDLIVTATASPDYSIPNMACQVQDKLGANRAAAIGILAGCAGFIYALTTACQFIENGSCKTALVTASDLPSAYVDFSHPKYTESQWLNATIFGDGAGAVVLKESGNKEGVLYGYIGSDGKKNGPFIIPEGGSKIRPNKTVLDEGLHFVNLKFREIVAYTPKFMEKSVREILLKSDLKLEEIDWVIPHQPTLPLVRRFFKKVGIPIEKAVIYVDKIGNTSDALIPISLDLARREGKIKKDDILLFVAAGAGWMYGANIVKWAV